MINKVDVNDLKKYVSDLNKSKSKKSDNTERINQLQNEVTSMKSNFQNRLAGKLDKSDSDQESVSIEDIKSIIKWKQNVVIILSIISTGLIGIIIKLLFFN